jgi:uncharacterized 2Fe-2S/4Fe-4S cluster protein (DUF4445 family)
MKRLHKNDLELPDSGIFRSGGFGSSLNIPKAIGIGLVPDIDPQKIQFLGNSCVMGSRMALLSCPAFESTQGAARKMTNIELSKYPAFMNESSPHCFCPILKKAFPQRSLPLCALISLTLPRKGSNLGPEMPLPVWLSIFLLLGIIP